MKLSGKMIEKLRTFLLDNAFKERSQNECILRPFWGLRILAQTLCQTKSYDTLVTEKLINIYFKGYTSNFDDFRML